MKKLEIPKSIPKKFHDNIIDIEKYYQDGKTRYCVWTRWLSDNLCHQAVGDTLKDVVIDLENMSECNCYDCLEDTKLWKVLA